MTETLTEQPDQSVRAKIASWAKGPLFYPIAVLVGFLEGSFVVVPMEPVYIPMMVMKRKQAWLVALALLLGNVLGGLLIYWLGAVLADDLLQPMISMFGAQETYDATLQKLREDGFTTLFMIGVTPFPFPSPSHSDSLACPHAGAVLSRRQAAGTRTVRHPFSARPASIRLALIRR